MRYCRPKAEELLPKSWASATSPEMKRWVPTPHRIQVFTTLVSPEPSTPGNGTIPSIVPVQDARQGAPHAYSGLRTDRTMENATVLHPQRSSSEYFIPGNVPPRTTGGSSVLEVLSSESTDEAAESTLPASAGNSISQRWRPFRAWYERLGLHKSRNRAQLESESDFDAPEASIGVVSQPHSLPVRGQDSILLDEQSSHTPSHPTSTTFGERDDDPVLLAHDSESAGSLIIPSPRPPLNVLTAFDERVQKLNKSIGWVYSAREMSKNEVGPGEPLFMWSVEVLVAGEVLGRGTGNSKKAGTRAAAEQALAFMHSHAASFGETSSSVSEVEFNGVVGDDYNVPLPGNV
ncbi:hypothetical protein B0H19DRAFT_300918 [Mycena capillaripes]|nr:hypothetical protein B0H19DRAFT_300918 [Mycena capillaripes]